MIAYTVIVVVLGTFALPFGTKIMGWVSYSFKLQMIILMIINYTYIICLNVYYLALYDPKINNFKLCGDFNNPYHKTFYKYGIRMIYGLFIASILIVWRCILLWMYVLERESKNSLYNLIFFKFIIFFLHE